MSNASAGRGRFARVSLVLGPSVGRAAALCQHTGRLGALPSPAALAVVESALGFAEERGVDDVREFENLFSASHVWGHLPSEYLTLPDLGEASLAVLDHIQHLLEQLAPEALREVAIAMSVEQHIVGVALELVEEAARGGAEFRVGSMAEFEEEMLLNDDRIGDAVDVLVWEAPGDWPPLQRGALVLALVWEIAELVGYAAELVAAEARPAELLWQAAGTGHLCAGVRVRVPGPGVLVWASVDEEDFEGRPLFSQAVQLGVWRWSLGWQTADGAPVFYKAGRGPSRAAARWRAEQAVLDLLADPYRVKSPVSGEWLLPPC
ncbi:hypothetical protein [Streptomyces sp. NRRL F-5630]|uniref:hypothetical protein n=1 Tax=Streptomyces sp. NRRL F-5630 TaxID=1463864 RepID=UPI00131E1362|nr:hypothetical protein [Streptomyces sp. NRRL F-5630]